MLLILLLHRKVTYDPDSSKEVFERTTYTLSITKTTERFTRCVDQTKESYFDLSNDDDDKDNSSKSKNKYLVVIFRNYDYKRNETSTDINERDLVRLRNFDGWMNDNIVRYHLMTCAHRIGKGRSNWYVFDT